MKRLIAIVLAVFFALMPGGATVSQRNGISITTASTINGRTPNSAINGQTIAAVDPDLEDWLSRVATAGGTVSGGTQTAVGNFITSAKANGYWSNIIRINLFCGDFAACMVPLKVGGGNTTETNMNFVSGDFSESTGLTGNGSTKYLKTGITNSQLTTDNVHLAVYNRAGSASVSAMGALTTVSNRLFIHHPWSDGIRTLTQSRRVSAPQFPRPTVGSPPRAPPPRSMRSIKTGRRLRWITPPRADRHHQPATFGCSHSMTPTRPRASSATRSAPTPSALD